MDRWLTIGKTENWRRVKSKESNDVIYYWKNNQNLVVAIKKYSSDVRPDWPNYEVVLVDKKNYGSVPVSNRRKVVGTGDNKERLKTAIVEWQRNNPDATRLDYDSLQRKLRSVKN